ncbi:mucin-17 [Aplysia californica]|uniref:Mucin-17 n=1 Tax=Aplysia californica TaxID=6500 RepID=A0ABM0K8S1_APLCA|nr:mucin-17 [Aplysia californica]
MNKEKSAVFQCSFCKTKYPSPAQLESHQLSCFVIVKQEVGAEEEHGNIAQTDNTDSPPDSCTSSSRDAVQDSISCVKEEVDEQLSTNICSQNKETMSPVAETSLSESAERRKSQVPPVVGAEKKSKEKPGQEQPRTEEVARLPTQQPHPIPQRVRKKKEKTEIPTKMRSLRPKGEEPFAMLYRNIRPATSSAVTSFLPGTATSVRAGNPTLSNPSLISVGAPSSVVQTPGTVSISSANDQSMSTFSFGPTLVAPSFQFPAPAPNVQMSQGAGPVLSYFPSMAMPIHGLNTNFQLPLANFQPNMFMGVSSAPLSMTMPATNIRLDGTAPVSENLISSSQGLPQPATQSSPVSSTGSAMSNAAVHISSPIRIPVVVDKQLISQPTVSVSSTSSAGIPVSSPLKNPLVVGNETANQPPSQNTVQNAAFAASSVSKIPLVENQLVLVDAAQILTQTHIKSPVAAAPNFLPGNNITHAVVDGPSSSQAMGQPVPVLTLPSNVLGTVEKSAIVDPAPPRLMPTPTNRKNMETNPPTVRQPRKGNRVPNVVTTTSLSVKSPVQNVLSRKTLGGANLSAISSPQTLNVSGLSSQKNAVRIDLSSPETKPHSGAVANSPSLDIPSSLKNSEKRPPDAGENLKLSNSESTLSKTRSLRERQCPSTVNGHLSAPKPISPEKNANSRKKSGFKNLRSTCARGNQQKPSMKTKPHLLSHGKGSYDAQQAQAIDLTVKKSDSSINATVCSPSVKPAPKTSLPTPQLQEYALDLTKKKTEPAAKPDEPVSESQVLKEGELSAAVTSSVTENTSSNKKDSGRVVAVHSVRKRARKRKASNPSFKPVTEISSQTKDSYPVTPAPSLKKRARRPNKAFASSEKTKMKPAVVTPVSSSLTTCSSVSNSVFTAPPSGVVLSPSAPSTPTPLVNSSSVAVTPTAIFPQPNSNFLVTPSFLPFTGNNENNITNFQLANQGFPLSNVHDKPGANVVLNSPPSAQNILLQNIINNHSSMMVPCPVVMSHSPVFLPPLSVPLASLPVPSPQVSVTSSSEQSSSLTQGTNQLALQSPVSVLAPSLLPQGSVPLTQTKPSPLLQGSVSSPQRPSPLPQGSVPSTQTRKLLPKVSSSSSQGLRPQASLPSPQTSAPSAHVSVEPPPMLDKLASLTAQVSVQLTLTKVPLLSSVTAVSKVHLSPALMTSSKQISALDTSAPAPSAHSPLLTPGRMTVGLPPGVASTSPGQGKKLSQKKTRASSNLKSMSTTQVTMSCTQEPVLSTHVSSSRTAPLGPQRGWGKDSRRKRNKKVSTVQQGMPDRDGSTTKATRSTPREKVGSEQISCSPVKKVDLSPQVESSSETKMCSASREKRVDAVMSPLPVPQVSDSARITAPGGMSETKTMLVGPLTKEDVNKILLNPSVLQNVVSVSGDLVISSKAIVVPSSNGPQKASNSGLALSPIPFAPVLNASSSTAPIPIAPFPASSVGHIPIAPMPATGVLLPHIPPLPSASVVVSSVFTPQPSVVVAPSTFAFSTLTSPTKNDTSVHRNSSPKVHRQMSSRNTHSSVSHLMTPKSSEADVSFGVAKPTVKRRSPSEHREHKRKKRRRLSTLKSSTGRSPQDCEGLGKMRSPKRKFLSEKRREELARERTKNAGIFNDESERQGPLSTNPRLTFVGNIDLLTSALKPASVALTRLVVSDKELERATRNCLNKKNSDSLSLQKDTHVSNKSFGSPSRKPPYKKRKIRRSREWLPTGEVSILAARVQSQAGAGSGHVEVTSQASRRSRRIRQKPKLDYADLERRPFKDLEGEIGGDSDSDFESWRDDGNFEIVVEHDVEEYSENNFGLANGIEPAVVSDIKEEDIKDLKSVAPLSAKNLEQVPSENADPLTRNACESHVASPNHTAVNRVMSGSQVISLEPNGRMLPQSCESMSSSAPVKPDDAEGCDEIVPSNNEEQNIHYSSESESDIFEDAGTVPENEPERKKLLRKRQQEVVKFLLKQAGNFTTEEEGDCHYCNICKSYKTNGVFSLSKHLNKHLNGTLKAPCV